MGLFIPRKYLLNNIWFILGGIILLPLIVVKSFFIEDKFFYLYKRIMDIILYVAYTLGVIHEAVLGEPYSGKKMDSSINFIKDLNILWG